MGGSVCALHVWGGHGPHTGSDLCAFHWLAVGAPDTFPCLHPCLPSHHPTVALSEAEIPFISELLKVPQKFPIAQRTGAGSGTTSPLPSLAQGPPLPARALGFCPPGFF